MGPGCRETCEGETEPKTSDKSGHIVIFGVPDISLSGQLEREKIRIGVPITIWDKWLSDDLFTVIITLKISFRVKFGPNCLKD